MKQPEILVIGSSNTDMILNVPRVPHPGETILGGAFSTAPGGKGANQAVAAARAGGKVTLVARVGRDTFGDAAIAGFQCDGINTRFVQRDPAEPSGIALICVGADGDNSIAVASGANARLSITDLKKASGAFRRAAVLLLQLESPLQTVTAAARMAKQHDIPVILNPAPAQTLPRSLLRDVSVLTPNETEAEMLTGVRVTGPASARRAAKILHEQDVPNVIITMGARGAFVRGPNQQFLVPAFCVKPVDSTAAGDVFNGALAVALAIDWDLTFATRFACAAAALSVTRPGAQPSAPNRREVVDFLRSAEKRGDNS